MARKKTSKAEHIRQALSAMGVDASPKNVVAALAGKKIKVSTAQVSNVKASLRGGRSSRRGRPSKNGAVSLSDLLVAKKFVDQIGIEQAREALAALAKLQ